MSRHSPNSAQVGYVELPGKNLLEQLPALFARGMQPLSICEVAQARLDAVQQAIYAGHEGADSPIWKRHMATGCGFAITSRGRLKVFQNAPYLRLLTEETRLVGETGLVQLDEELYNLWPGTTFEPQQVKDYCGHRIREAAEAVKNPILLELFCKGEELLRNYFSEARRLSSIGNAFDGLSVEAPPWPKYSSIYAAATLVVMGMAGPGIEPNFLPADLSADCFKYVLIGKPGYRTGAEQQTQGLNQRLIHVPNPPQYPGAHIGADRGIEAALRQA